MRGEIAFEPALARAGRAARRPAGGRHRRGAARPDHAQSRRADVGADDAGERGAASPSCRAASASSPRAVAERIGADEDRANTLDDRGRAGSPARSVEPVLGQDAKLEALARDGRRDAASNLPDAGGRRRRQRPRHAARGGARRRLSRQAQGRGRGRRPDRPRGPHRAPLCAGLPGGEEFVDD